jgi:hypothetical protein
MSAIEPATAGQNGAVAFATNFMIRRAGLGLAIANAMRTRRGCCLPVWFLLQGELISAAPTPVRNSMIRRSGVGVPLVISTPGAISTQQRCCSTAWSLPPEDLISASLLWRALNCMLLRGRRPRQHQQPRRRQALRLVHSLRLPQPTVTPTPSPTATPTPTVTPRPIPTPRLRPTPPPRPTPR